ncbi:sensor histidine kinase [Methylocystis heyeri]|uniref:histidine kinase n=1 Tax=Methylocystis heyeri TaxID=391905 RepID=A0A6B8KID1_9HYPH|nr:PAS domain-containing sensor histidine kinase [Methylocystis heyeri]QGM46270.1 PAS domain S-box protein [Methylocystis heyeri]
MGLHSIGYDIFRLAVEAAPAAMIVTNRDGIIEYVNSETEHMFGFSVQELIGQCVDMLVPPTLRADHADLRRSYLDQPEKRLMGAGRDLKAVRRDGSEFSVEIGLAPIPTEDGLLILATVLDISARRQAEAALALRASELERANTRLAQFAYVASHDLQEPLRKIAAFSDLLEQAMAASELGEAKQATEIIRKSALRARNLVDDLLTYSRTINDTQVLKQLDLREEIEAALGDLSQSIEDAGAQLVLDVPHLTFRADRSQFARLVQNILSNAIKYRKPDVPPRIVIRSTPVDGDGFVLEISDNGIGFDEKYARTIFEPFRRLHSQTQYPGTGIGLAICKSIVDRHGWSMSIRSSPGEGASFFIGVGGPQETADRLRHLARRNSQPL